jgi:serine/threonine-protein kinase RsbW
MSPPVPCPALEIIIASDLNEARRVQAEIEAALRAIPFADHDIFAIRLALEEALVNAIKHGNQLDRAKAVHVSYRVGPDRFEVQIADEGPGFDPDDVPDPTAPENLERPCGRGLLLMRHYMTEVAYTDCGRAVRMAKVCNGVK